MNKQIILIKNRILQNIKVNKKTGCWEWQLNCFAFGYGIFYINKKLKHAHRVAFEIFKGPIPKGLCVCHSCDVPSCCNPDHLWLGTLKDNAQDRARKGRNRDQRGSKNNQAKLTKEDVVEIRILLSKDELGTAIAKQFSVTYGTISKIKLGTTWNWLII